MRVGYFALSETFNAPHAGFVHTYNMVKNLVNGGVNIRLFIETSEKEFHDEGNFEIIFVILPKLVTVLKSNPISYIKSFIKVKKMTKDLDIIHERFHINPIDLLFIGNKKYVLEVNDPGIELYSGLKDKIYSYLIKKKFRRCDVIITQTKTLKRILEKHTEKPIYVVPNGVDTSFFKPDLESDIRVRYGISDDEILITFVGAFREWHGVQDIVTIADKIHREDVKFMLVGSGPLYNEINEKCKDKKNIILTGPQKHGDMPKFLAASDILIAPFNTSRFKGLEKFGFWWSPVKLFEYMASGRAIVSYNFKEVRNIIKDGGVLAEPGKLDDFVEKLLIVIENKMLRDELGSKARKIAELQYNWFKRANEIIKVYESI